VLGEIREIPDWAAHRLSVMAAEKDMAKQPENEKQEPEKVGGYTIIKRAKIGDIKIVMGENPDAPSPFATWRQSAGRSGCDSGHYFITRRAAEADMQSRVTKEWEYQTPDGTHKPKARSEAR